MATRDTTDEALRLERITVSLESLANSLEQIVELLRARAGKGKGR